MPWQETQTHIQNGLRSPSEFQENTLQSVQLTGKVGVEAIVGKPKGKQTFEVQSYLFSKDKGWSKRKAQNWQSKLQAPVYLEKVTAEAAVEQVNGVEVGGQGLRFESEMGLVAVSGVPDANIEILEGLQVQTDFAVNGEYILGFYQDPFEFLPEGFRVVWLDRGNGVLAVLGKLRSEPGCERTLAIYFSSEKQWDQSRIQSWLAAHTAYIIPAGGTPTVAQDMPVVESLVGKTVEPSVSVSQVVGMIRDVLPSSLVQRSWGLGPQRMCQELNSVICRLQRMAE